MIGAKDTAYKEERCTRRAKLPGITAGGLISSVLFRPNRCRRTLRGLTNSCRCGCLPQRTKGPKMNNRLVAE